MKLERILELVDLLPANAPYPVQAPQPMLNAFFSSRRSAENNRRVAAKTDPRFGWKFVMCFVRSGKYIPELAADPVLWRAYRYEACRAEDPLMAEALDLDQPRMHFVSNLVRACLIIKELSYQDISQKTNVPAAAIRIYEELFFNVRDRMEDTAYIASLVYPDHRTVELNPRYGLLTDAGQFLLRMAWQHGLEPMLMLAGVLKEGGESQAGEISRRLESAIMSNALQLNRMGLLNQNNVPGLMHARSIITAIKQSGQEDKADDSEMGLGALSMGDGVMQTLKGIQQPEIAKRRKLKEGTHVPKKQLADAK